MSETDFNEISIKFEGVKIGMRHTKDGHVVSFAVHPNDTPHDLMADPLGQRYMIVAVRIDGNDQPVASQNTEDGRKSIALAGTLCNDSKFRQWLIISGEIDDDTEMAASVWMRKYLNVTSRKELMHDAKARAKLAGLRDEFVAAIRNGALY